MQDAAEMARRLKLNKLVPSTILSSPARRAYATAALFANTLHLAENQIAPDERIYTADINELLTIVRTSPAGDHLMLVAHNPTLTEFADKLSGERRIDALPTCGVVTMRIAVAAWSELNWHRGADVELDYPGKST